LVGLRWAGALGPLFKKCRVKKQMVKCKARLRVNARYEVKSASEG
jgi:hypothetical protein